MKVISINEPKKWDETVRSFSNYDVYYLIDYLKAFQLNGDGIPLLFYFENATTRAMNVVMKRDVADFELLKGKIESDTYFDISTPYGYGGFLVEGDDFRALNHAYTEYCVQENIICEFVRFHPLLENWVGLETMYNIMHLGDTVSLDTSSDDVIWKNVSSKNRNVIRKAIKSGLKTYWCREPSIIEPFMSIYNATMDKDSAVSYYYFNREFYESILEDLKHNALWFYTELNGEIAAIAIFIFCNGKMHYHLSASRKEFQSLAPVNLLIYGAAIWACHNGYKRLHLGGGVGSGHDNLYKFKKSFNREQDCEFYIGNKIFNEEQYNEMLEIRKRTSEFDESTPYFPAYKG